VPSFKYGVVTPAILTEQRTDVPSPNNNISIPIGTVKAVRDYLNKLGLGPVFAEIKKKGVPLSPLVTALVRYRLTENFSVDGCGRWLEDRSVRDLVGLKDEVSHRTVYRAVEDIGENMKGVLSAARSSILWTYDFPHTDVNIDSSSLSVYSKQSSLFSFGYSRDKRPDLRQVNFCVAELRKPVNIPIHMTVSPGNSPDCVQFIEMIEDLSRFLDEGSTAVMDAAGEDKDIAALLTSKGMRYLVRKKMNESDDKVIAEFDKEKAASVDREKGVWCVKRVFGSSQRTNYLFFSQKLYDDKMRALDSRAWRCVEEYFEVVRMKEDGTLKVSKTMLRKLRNPLIYCNVSVQTTLLREKEEMYSFVREYLSNGREGFFKLESSEELTEEQAYRMYRERDTIEKLIESLKNHLDMGPLRVWSDACVRGILTICFLAQTIVSMIRFEHSELSSVSSRNIIRSLEKLTLTAIRDGSRVRSRIFSNFDPVSSMILGCRPSSGRASGG
jgi:transposase